jgi:glutamine synthetase
VPRCRVPHLESKVAPLGGVEGVEVVRRRDVPVAHPGGAARGRLAGSSDEERRTGRSPGSVILAAGLKGIEEGYELPPETVANVFELTDEERAAERLRLRALTQSLHDALREMEQSELVAESLGEHIFEWFLGNKRTGWRRYSLRVTPFEIEQYLRTS